TAQTHRGCEHLRRRTCRGVPAARADPQGSRFHSSFDPPRWPPLTATLACRTGLQRCCHGCGNGLVRKEPDYSFRAIVLKPSRANAAVSNFTDWSQCQLSTIL